MPDLSSRPPARRGYPAWAAACATGIALGLLAGTAFAVESPAQAPNSDVAASAFDRLKALEGTWRIADREDHPLRIRFYPSAGGSALVESWDVNGRSHSLTIYHRDGDTLLATHYCPQGNQPRMALDQDDEQVRFTFRDATDLDASKEQHQHTLAFDLQPADRIVRSEQYMDGQGSLHPSELVLIRVPDDEG